MTPQDTMRLALEALENSSEIVFMDKDKAHLREAAIEALRSALAQQGEQPVAEVVEHGNSYAKVKLLGDAFGITKVGDKFYTATPASQPDQRFTNLLCRIHRDGGHYIAEHGFDKAVLDADTKVAQLNAMSDAPAAQPETWIDDGGWEFPIERQIIQTQITKDISTAQPDLNAAFAALREAANGIGVQK